MEAKEQKHSKINFVVAIGAGLLLAAVIGFIVFRVQKSLKDTNAVNETTVDTISVTEHRQDTVKPKGTGPDSTKLRALFAQYFRKDSVPSKYPKFLTEAFIGYSFGDYLYLRQLDFSALPETLETIEGNNKETILQLGHYYKGIAGLLVNDSAQAITNLQWSIDHASSIMSIKAKWFLALAYLKFLHPEKAIPLFNEVSASKLVEYRDQSKALLKELKAG